VCALLSGAARELIWGIPVVYRELRRWRSAALRIPDPKIRADALDALDRKRGNTHGAALFWVIPRARNRHLLALLVTYQVMWDFLDCVSESGAAAGQVNGYQLHLALVDALDPSRPLGEHFALHPWKDDGGYLHALVRACRSHCRELPGIEKVRPTLLREAHRAGVQAINHDLNPLRREAALRQWAAREYPERKDVAWFELTGAAGAGLAIYALFVLATEPGCSDTDVKRVYQAYFPWAGAVATMLDSFVDEPEDRERGDHCYVSYYGTSARARQGIARLVERCTRETHSLADSERHTLIVACMVAMYLSKASARSEQLREATEALLNAGGELTRFLLPVLRLWRALNAQRST
jgi:tetraprenyl-beta-curcumene synthase